MSKKFHIAINQLNNINEYDLKIVICEDFPSLMHSDETISSRSGNTEPELLLNDKIVVDKDGEKLKIEYEYEDDTTSVNTPVVNEALNNIQLFPNPIKSGNPITIQSEKPMKVQLQLIDTQGCIHHQSIEYLRASDNTIHGLSTNLVKGVYFIRFIDDFLLTLLYPSNNSPTYHFNSSRSGSLK